MMSRRRHRTSDLPVGRPTWASRKARIDAAFEAYLDWLDESRTVAWLYRRWNQAPRGDRRACFAAYAAALEREQRAAQVYAAIWNAALEG